MASGGRHRFDAGAAVAGLFFLTAAGIFLAGAIAGDPVVPLDYLAAGTLIGLGVVGIIRVLTRGLRRDL
ncbi:hypothetical protein [Thermomonospora umbrina]|uniref:Uncharacterized protein n=1 Tax=Thermomonospora umbrina TaxID=111806 RepID=A0A3D9SRI5_9ACTN|nr:hypothetical protein [Thermomonospora umbrina]REE98227.1 hypothetical protein DFJ69_3711 [Thermomonospora umbrina]